MKTILKTILITSVLVFGSTTLFAGSGHTHGGSTHVHDKITEQKAIEIAKSMKDGLAKKGTIADSWKSIDTVQINKKTFGNDEEWVISFQNPQIEEKSKTTLFVFINLYGKVTGANYTGK